MSHPLKIILFQVEGNLSKLANPLNPVRLESILKELEQLEAKVSHEDEGAAEGADEGAGEESMIFYGDDEPDQEASKTSQEPCQCSRNSKCQTKKFCLCFKNNMTCVPMCHVNSGSCCKNVKNF